MVGDKQETKFGGVMSALKTHIIPASVFHFFHIISSNFIVFVARLLNWCLVWMQVHWSKKAAVGSNFGAYGGYA